MHLSICAPYFRNLFCSVILIFVSAIQASAQSASASNYQTNHLKLSLLQNPESQMDSAVGIMFEIEPGWHIYGPNPGAIGKPTTIKWESPSSVIGSTSWPVAEEFPFDGKTSYGYQGAVIATAPITGGTNSATLVTANISWLLCKDECIPGKTSLTGEVKINSGSGSASFWTLLLAALIGGSLLNLMPCVFPVLSLKILALAENNDRTSAIHHAVAYVSGIIISFWILAAVLISMRAVGAHIGWGFQLQSPIFVASMALVMFAIGLNLLGVFEFGLAIQKTAGRFDKHRGLYGSFLSGILSTLLATPCSAPFMATAVSAALAVGYFQSIGIFTALGIGMAVPYLLLALRPGWQRCLPKPGMWMIRLRQFLAFPMFATVIWLLWVLSVEVGAAMLINFLWALLALAFGSWIFGSAQTAGFAKFNCSLLRLLGISAVAGAVLMAVNACSEIPADAVDKTSIGKSINSEAVAWEPYSAKRLDDLRAGNRPVLLEFTAAWCLTCQANHRLLFSSSRVINTLREKDVVLMIADWTKNDPEITTAISSYGRSGVPLNVFLDPGHRQPVILPQILTADTLIETVSGLPSAQKDQIRKTETSDRRKPCFDGTAENIECEKG